MIALPFKVIFAAACASCRLILGNGDASLGRLTIIFYHESLFLVTIKTRLISPIFIAKICLENAKTKRKEYVKFSFFKIKRRENSIKQEISLH